MVTTSRRALFDKILGRKKEDDKNPIIRPPFALSNGSWSVCMECEGHCEAKCPTHVIMRMQDGSPALIFASNGCTLCGDCAAACAPNQTKSESIKAIAKLGITECMAWQKTMCYSCKDACIYGAVSFAGLYFPQIVDANCTGCGFCTARCPADAITMEAI